MPKLKIIELDKELDVEPGMPILMAASLQGVNFGFICGGNAACGTCTIVVKDGADSLKPRNSKESFLAKAMMLGDDQRLGCQTEMGSADLTVSIPALGRPPSPFSLPFPR